MKVACAFACFALWHLASFSQANSSAAWQKNIRELNTKFHLLSYATTGKTNIAPPSKGISVSDLQSPASLQSFIHNNGSLNTKQEYLNRPANQLPTSAISCHDTSFIRLLQTAGTWIYVEKMVPLSDDGTLILGLIYDTTKTYFIKSGYALIIKTDNLGNVSWIKQLDDPAPTSFFTFFMYNAFELSNKDLICVGSIDTTSNLNNSNTILYRLDKNGTILWQKGLHTTFVNNFPQISIDISGVTEGLNGDLILCGTTESSNNPDLTETIIRLDKSGNKIWDANYGNTLASKEGAEGLAIYFQNGELLEVGITHGDDISGTPAAVNFLTLDYNSGNLLTTRFFRPDYADKNTTLDKTFTYSGNQCTRLANGHFIAAGKLFSDALSNTPVIDHFGIMEFDNSLNLVNSYTISSSLHTNYFNNTLFFNTQGKGLVALFQYVNRLNAVLYFGAFENRQFLNQRKKNYNNIALPNTGSFSYTNDSGYVFLQSYFDGGSRTFIEFRKMHNSDTTSVCLGDQTFLMQFLPLHVIEDKTFSYLNNKISNKIQLVNYSLIASDTLQVLSLDPCKQINYCDSLKIQGTSFCGSTESILFTAHKNPACGGITQWNIDSTSVDSLKPQSDSTVLIHFKDVNWKGNLYATLPQGKCTLAADSLPVTVIMLKQPINLGADTLLCRGNTRLLHAGAGFSSYKWQDGSTDSTYKVTKAGTYFVSALDNCGNTYGDTIHFTSVDFNFSIGNDTVLCNNIPIRLTATPGFTSYQWRPNYNISSDTAQSVLISPTRDTTYFATAEKWPGCSFADTIKVRLLTSTTVHLGNDTSICAIQNLALDAGPGFISYLWSTASTQRQIKVSSPGIYFVKATAANTCTSSDTIQLSNFGPPLQILGNDTSLCQGNVYAYNLNLPGASYLWNDGSTSGNYRITQAGVYSLTVVQQGCIVKDTVVISYKITPIFSLGNDTTLCRGDTLAFDIGYDNASYLWQDGSTLDDFAVTTSGLYYVTVNLNGCITSDTIAVNYTDVPRFTLGKDTSICKGETIVLHPVLSIAAQYLWQDGSNNLTLAITEAGIYSLKASNSCGSFLDTIAITQGLCNLLFPNAFTPNGDGINDIFKVKYVFAVKSFSLSVFNRFGQKIFESSDMSKGWDGSYRGIPQSPDVYTWITKITTLDNVEKSSKGIITLLR